MTVAATAPAPRPVLPARRPRWWTDVGTIAPTVFALANAVGAIIAVRRGHRIGTVGLTLLSILASPVAGAFVAMGLSGTFLTTRTRAYRPIIAYAVITAGVALALSALAFGTPGPEPFSDG